jgi:hypothetical protein
MKLMRSLGAAAPALFLISAAPHASASPILLSNLASFAVLGASTVTNTGPTTLTGSLGVSPGSAITGFLGTVENDGPGSINSGTGTVQEGNAFAITAQSQLSTAMSDLAGLSSVATTILGGDLTGLSLPPGVYSVADRAAVLGGNLHGTLTLNGTGGAANGGWVFLLPARLITAPGAVVDASSLGPGAAVYWLVGSSATLDTTTTFAGNILASASITMNNGVTLGCGRALAHTAAVTMINDTIGGGCSGALSGSAELTGGVTGGGVKDSGGVVTVALGEGIPPVVVAPEPGTFVLLGAGIACLVAWRPRSARGRQRDLA